MNRFPGSLVLLRLVRLSSRNFAAAARNATFLVLALVGVLGFEALAQTATTTTLAITSGGSAATTVSMGTVVTLTATVVAGTTPVSPGQVEFCDATAAHCEDIHIVGTAQLTSAGTAVVKFRPGVGSHSYNAVFVGTPGGSPVYAGSASGNAALTVTAPALYPSVTTMSVAGTTGTYQLGATVSGIGAAPPTGSVSFIDTSAGNASLGTASLSNASSTFGLVNVSNPAAGTGPGATVVADFNRDGIPDIATVAENFDANTSLVTILLGNGDGTFTPVAGQTLNFLADATVAGDFNGDGIPDLAVTNGSDAVVILLGKGDGTFTSAGTTPSVGGTGYMPRGELLAAGDFNGDGNLDIAAVSEDDDGIENASQITILLGDGNGGFTAGPTTALTGGIPAGLVFSSMAVSDFNGDGKLDIAASSHPSGACPGQACAGAGLTILLGNGDGTFNLSSIDEGAASLLGTVVAADFNGDGIPDLAVTNSYVPGNGLVYLLQGNGDGTFTPPNPISLGTDQPYLLAVGDFAGNGIADLALTISESEPPYSNVVSVLWGKGDGTFATPPYQVNPFSAEADDDLAGIAVGDFNGDGLQDLTVTTHDSNSVAVLESQTQFDTAPPQTPIVLNGVGTHLIAASYQGDANYSPSISAATALNLSSGAPTVTLTLSANPINYGTPETSTVVVSGNGPTPTGTVTVTYNGLPGVFPQSQPCEATLNNSGVATCALAPTTLGGGMYSVVASYSGDTNYPSASSSPTSLSVYNQTNPEISWNYPAPVTYGTALGPQQLNAFSNAPGTFSYSPAAGTVLSAGTYTLTATFTPTNPLTTSSATATVPFTVLQATPTVNWFNPPPIIYGTALSATQLNAASPVAGTFAYSPAAGTVLGAGSHTLSVTFTPTDTTDYTTATASVTITVTQATPTITWAAPAAISYGTALSATQLNATASVPGSFVYMPAAGTVPAVGSQTLSVTFTPTDATDYATATSTVTLVVSKAMPTIGLTTSGSSAYVLNPVIFTATLTSTAGTPTGTVAFYDGTALLGTEAMTSGIAIYQTSALLAGTHSITAVYSGDMNFATATSSVLSQVIENFTFGSSGGTSSVTASPGGQAVYTFTMTPPTGTTFAGPISFSVTGLPTGATAAFTPATVPAGAGTTTVTMTVTLAASAALRPAEKLFPEKRFPGGALPIALGLILLPFAGRLRRTARGLTGTVCLLVIGLGLAAGLTSCGGSGGSGGGGSEGTPETYILTVTASAGPLSNVSTVELVVQ
jgi:hypothetical protein